MANKQKPTIVTFHLKAEGEAFSTGQHRKRMIEKIAKAESRRLGRRVSEAQILRDMIDLNSPL